MRIIVAGATGFVGRALVPLLRAKGHAVFKLTRKESDLAEDEIHWNPISGQLDAAALEGADVIVNLAGENVASRWTESKKQLILQSRISATRLLVKAISLLKAPPKQLVNASAIGFYGSRGCEKVDEASSSGLGFLANVCRQWESAALTGDPKGLKVALIRIGVVLGKEGGALASMLTPFKLGLGGVVGSGDQWMSWISLQDLVAIIAFVIEKGLEGPINAVAPHPVTNKDFTKVLGTTLNRPTIFPMPAFAARLLFGEMADELLLGSTRVVPDRLLKEGFQFATPTLNTALELILNNKTMAAKSCCTKEGI